MSYPIIGPVFVTAVEILTIALFIRIYNRRKNNNKKVKNIIYYVNKK